MTSQMRDYHTNREGWKVHIRSQINRQSRILECTGLCKERLDTSGQRRLLCIQNESNKALKQTNAGRNGRQTTCKIVRADDKIQEANPT